MRILIYILFPFLIIPLTDDGTKKCVIKPSVGVDDIVIDSSYLKDVVEDFTKSKIEKRWVKAVETELFGRYERFVNVPNVAKFSSLSRNKKISKIVFQSPCNCKTKEGVGIGSSYNKTLSVFGKPRFAYINQEGNEHRIQLIYNNMYIKFDGNDTIKSVIYQIKIF
jgi:hypothetical protein